MGVANIKRQVMMKVMKSKHLKFIFPFLERALYIKGFHPLILLFQIDFVAHLWHNGIMAAEKGVLLCSISIPQLSNA